MGTTEASGVAVLSSSSSDLKAVERDMWDHMEEWAADPLRNPLLLGWHSLCSVLAEMALPALARLADEPAAYPEGFTLDEWQTVLTHIHEAFRQIVALERWEDEPAYDGEYVAEGLRLFGAHFAHLWD